MPKLEISSDVTPISIKSSLPETKPTPSSFSLTVLRFTLANTLSVTPEPNGSTESQGDWGAGIFSPVGAALKSLLQEALFLPKLDSHRKDAEVAKEHSFPLPLRGGKRKGLRQQKPSISKG